MGFVSLATVLFTALAVVFAMVSALVAGFANSVLVIPYMDEIFHIGQVQKYCQGNFQHVSIVMYK